MHSFLYEYLFGLVGQEFGTLMVPAGDVGGDTLRWFPSLSPWWGMFMFRGFIDIFGGEGISSLSALSDSSIKDSKKSLILVLGNRIEHLWEKKKCWLRNTISKHTLFFRYLFLISNF